MKKKMMALLLTVSVICGMLSGCGGAPSSSASSEDGLPTYDLKMTAGITKDQPHGLAAQWMIDEIYERSNGRIKITLYDNNTLGTERECAEGVQTGNFDFAIVNMSVMRIRSSCWRLTAFLKSINTRQRPNTFITARSR